VSDELDEIQAIFFEECAEGLTAAEAGLSAMKAGDADAETIASVFRAVHSIKGGAGAFGHVDLTAFAHRFENVLDEVRAGRIAPSAGVVKVMLSSFDILSDHVAYAKGSAERPNDTAALTALEEILKNGGAGDAGEAPAAPVAEAPAPPPAEEEDPFGFTPVLVSLDDFDVVAEPAAAPPAADGDWIVCFGPSRAALSNASEPMLVIRELESMGAEIVHVDTSALPGLRDLDTEDSYFIWKLIAPGTLSESEIRDCFDFVAPDSLIEITRCEAAPAAPVLEIEIAPVEAAPTISDDTFVPIEPIVSAAPAAPQLRVVEVDDPGKPARMEAAAQTIRVDLGKLDMLLNLVGELVIRNSILADRLSPQDQQRVELPELARLTRQIQDNVMSLRAQPIKQAFSRVPRMLRDLGEATGKQVNLITTGDTTEVDKAVIEKIGDPLTHMIRNAVDHGIESTEKRLAAGKPAEGTIHLSAEQKGARIFVRVKDDGGGINRERVRAKAVERGLIAADAVMTDEEIDQLICAPGFSTAESISNISGRGVGMDVVRSNVEALGGRVEIQSVPGQGTSITMILPLTLAILDGMIVKLAGQRFVLPLASVVEAVRPEPGQVMMTTPGNEVIEMRGQYVPVKRATDIFGIADTRKPEEALVIIVESESVGHVGLMVDTIDDRREVVIKSLDQNLHPIRGLGGATILGDGSIALILDIEALVSHPTAHRFAMKGMAA